MKLFVICVSLLVCCSIISGSHISCDNVNAYQSSTGTWGGIVAGARLAIDDNISPKWFDGGCTHTAPNDADPYLTIDLGCEKTVRQVDITNRGDACCSGRLNNFEVVLTSEPYTPASRCAVAVCAFYEGKFPAGKKSVECVGKGRFVTIRYKNPEKQPSDHRYLHICDIKVITA